MLKQGCVQEAIGDIQLPPQLPPLNNLPQWSRINTLDRARYPKPFLKDRLQPLPNNMMDGSVDGDMEDMSVEQTGEAPSGEVTGAADGMDPQMRLVHLQRSVRFLQQQHQDVLHNLHSEIDELKRENKDLQFRIIMIQQGSPPIMSPSKPSSGTKTRSAKANRGAPTPVKGNQSTEEESSGTTTVAGTEEKIDEVKIIFLEEEIKELKKTLRDERNKNEYLTQLIEQAQSRFLEEGYKEEHLSEAQSAPPHTHKQVGGAVGGRQVEESHLPVREGLPYSATLDPLQVLDVSGHKRPPTTEECQVIIKHLLRLNDRQAHELGQLKSDLRDVLYSHKWSPDAYLLAKAYVMEDEARETANRERLPRLQLKQPTRKLPDLAYIQRDQVMLPALKQTMGNKAIERRKRTQILQKSRQRREVLH